ncbi:hypothetical protein BDZ90DRAFT_217255 [Jaminaea rosea]|uniref:Deoxycytidylate deaminase n=1 Tax=Jaminaea rosea TaxID=1569628 RepID=A0A316UXM3_9BASI|nr:hypothetical protein BDZ90DRAFT_217255 [Jaminaea rosea]PWN29744.1 hypothetical protein BDZ90DRAFT_217255 [Jaminaea rosea]
MLIALIGPPQSGKQTVADYLVSQHGFTLVCIPGRNSHRISQPSSPSSSSSSTYKPLSFDSPRSLLDHATAHWREKLVTLDLCTLADVQVGFDKRPFFLLVGIDAPLGRLAATGRLIPLLASLDFSTHLIVLNPFPSLSPLHAHLDTLDLPSPHRLRPSWDAYFLSLCSLASLRSNCMKRRVGAVLVSTSEKRVLSTGYNGTPRGLTNCADGGCKRCNDPLATGRGGANLTECFCLHAEENALLEVGRGLARGATLYCNTCPCMRCAVKIVQVGVDEVVYQLDYSVDHRSADIFTAAGVKIRKYGEAVK